MNRLIAALALLLALSPLAAAQEDTTTDYNVDVNLKENENDGANVAADDDPQESTVLFGLNPVMFLVIVVVAVLLVVLLVVALNRRDVPP